MKTSFRQFLSELNRKHDLRRRLISLLCVLSLVVSGTVSLLLTLPGITMTTAIDPPLNNGISEVVTDPMSHNGWINYFGINANGAGTYNTEFVGSIWTDKTVTQSYTTYRGQTINPSAKDNMLGVLSAIGSSQAITGRIYTPTDVMLILDLSSSMYSGTSYNSTNLSNMVKAVNNSITTLLAMNEYNRVGVTIYYGGNNTNINDGSTTGYGVTLLELDRYKIANSYLTLTWKSGTSTDAGRNKYITVKATAEDGRQVDKKFGDPLVGTAGTYAQLGIQNARDQFLQVAEDDTYVTYNVGGNEVKIVRQPIFIFMSDGRPTASHSEFDDLGRTSATDTSEHMAEWGLNSEAWRTSDASDFVFQLTAAYSKLAVEDHYGNEPYFYTLGLGVNKVSMNVMDPMGNDKSDAEKADQKKIAQWWADLASGKTVELTVWSNTKDYGWPYGTNDTQADKEAAMSKKKMYVRPVTVAFTNEDNEKTTTFPSAADQRDYVDEYFQADDATKLSDAFTAIVNEIMLKSIYTPTEVSGVHVNTSGEVSFIDQIGQYMEVKDIKGILMGGILHTGEEFMKTLMDPDAVGELYKPTAFGMTFWNNIIEQLGLDHVYKTTDENGNTTGEKVEVVQKTNELIRQAYDAGQLAYDATAGTFSNYIGWYQGTLADGTPDSYIGFWDGKDTSTPPENATARIKSYFFRGRVDSSQNQTYDTDMMYITVWVKEDVVNGVPTGNQTVVFSVPASLLPTLKYFVKLDENGDLLSIHLGDVDQDTIFNDKGEITVRPVRLIYEVGLQDEITAQNVLDMVSQEYRDNNSKDGKIYFYSNEWERDGSYGDGKVNTYSYFRPSAFNDRYYYVDDMPVYINTAAEGADPVYVEYNETLHGQLDITKDLYTQHPKYSRIKKDDGDPDTDTDDVVGEYITSGYYYMPLGDKVIENKASSMYYDEAADTWYVKAGVKHELTYTTTTTTTTTRRFERPKVDESGATVNPTGTLAWRNAPTQNVTSTEFILASTLGNNGRIALEPKGQVLQKKLVNADGTPYVAQETQTFHFLLHEGEPLEGVDYNKGAEVAAALGDQKITYIILTVSPQSSETGVKGLYDLTEYVWRETAWQPVSSETAKWECIYDKQYTLVELDDNKRFGFVSFSEVSEGNSTKSTVQDAPVYSFIYGDYPDGDTEHIIEATNQFLPWQITLTKTDKDTNSTVLPGAIFGIYSPREADKLPALPNGYGQFDLENIGKVQENHPATGQSTAWHLMGVATTDDTGQINWQNLTQEEYLIVELSPPPGYYRPAQDAARHFVQRSDADKDTSTTKLVLATLNVTNTPGFEMPSTGGAGTSQYIFIGSAIMGISACLMVVYHRKRKEELA